MTFDPASGELACPYCGGKKVIETEQGKTIVEHDFTYDLPQTEWGTTTSVVHCNNCGAEMVVPENSIAQFCAFCGSPILVKNENAQTISPEAVVPFKITQEKAINAFKTWIKGKFFSPGSLKNENQVQKLKGIYIPFFTYDSNTSSTYTAQAGTHYYTTESYTTEENGHTVTHQREVQHTSWRPVSGGLDKFFNDVLIIASKYVDKNLVKLTFNLSELVPYQKDYIFGFLAENNSISKDDCWIKARDVIETNIQTDIKSSIKADEVAELVVHTNYSDVKFKAILLPVWISIYTFKGKKYKFMVNGQSGEVKGQAPLSASRILMSILLTLGIPALFFFLLNHVVGIIVFVIAVITLIGLANKKTN
jgi:DNA-directed RNA polymerase subunit RPC12/RpoP